MYVESTILISASQNFGTSVSATLEATETLEATVTLEGKWNKLYN